MKKKLRERFFNTYKNSNHDNNEFILFLQKGAYPYECMDEKNYNEESDEGFLEVDIQYLENFRELHNNLPFLSERIKSL